MCNSYMGLTSLTVLGKVYGRVLIGDLERALLVIAAQTLYYERFESSWSLVSFLQVHLDGADRGEHGAGDEGRNPAHLHPHQHNQVIMKYLDT